MRVLLVNDYATPTAGAELMTLTLRDGLRARGHDARVFASRAQLIPGDSFADYACFGTTGRLQPLVELGNPSAYRQLRRALAEFRPDVVHVRMFLWQLSPLIMPLLRGVPSLYHVVTYKPICPIGSKLLPDGTPCTVPAGAACYRNRCLTARSWPPLILQVRLWRRWRDAFDLLVANSRAVAARLAAEGIAPVETVWNGVPARPPRPPPAGPPTVAYAGRLAREKGVDVLLRAFAQVARQAPEARLILAGAGPAEPDLRRLIAELDFAARVELTGQLSRPELERRFAGAWVQAVPSLWAEPFGIVAAEGLMRGTAVVASDSGGLAEIVRHGETGLLVPPGDVDALAATLLAPLRDRALAERWGRTGREVALRHFNADTYVDRIVELYDQSRAKRRPRSDARTTP